MDLDEIQKQIWKKEKEFLTKQIALMLVKDGAIKFGDFKLVSGISSPYYVDLRLMLSEPNTFDWITNSMTRIILNEIGKDKVDKVLGVPTAGVPFATAVSQKLSVPLIYVRKEKKVHGLKRQIEGKLEKDDRVVMIDDLISTGQSAVKFADIVKENKANVTDAVVLLDRMQGGKETLSRNNINLHYLFDVEQAFAWLHEVKLLDDEKYDVLRKYINDERHNNR